MLKQVAFSYAQLETATKLLHWTVELKKTKTKKTFSTSFQHLMRFYIYKRYTFRFIFKNLQLIEYVVFIMS